MAVGVALASAAIITLVIAIIVVVVVVVVVDDDDVVVIVATVLVAAAVAISITTLVTANTITITITIAVAAAAFPANFSTHGVHRLQRVEQVKGLALCTSHSRVRVKAEERRWSMAGKGLDTPHERCVRAQKSEKASDKVAQQDERGREKCQI